MTDWQDRSKEVRLALEQARHCRDEALRFPPGPVRDGFLKAAERYEAVARRFKYVPKVNIVTK